MLAANSGTYTFAYVGTFAPGNEKLATQTIFKVVSSLTETPFRLYSRRLSTDRWVVSPISLTVLPLEQVEPPIRTEEEAG